MPTEPPHWPEGADYERADYQAYGLPEMRILANSGCPRPPFIHGFELGGVARPGIAEQAKSRSPLIAGILACLPWIARSWVLAGTRSVMGTASGDGVGKT